MSPQPFGAAGFPGAGDLPGVLVAFGTALLFWFANMALTGWLAGRRGRDDGLWTVLALFLGPIALLAVWVSSRRSRPLDEPGPRVSYVPGWPVIPDPLPPITIAQRLIGALLGAGAGALGGGLLAGVGALEPAVGYVIIGAGAGALAGYGLSGGLIGADRGRLLVIGIVAGVFVLPMAGLLIGLARAIFAISAGHAGFEVVPLYLIGAILFPLINALFYPGVFLASVPAALLWAGVTRLLLGQRPSQDVAPASPQVR